MPYNVKIELESLLKEINQVVRASSIYLFGSYVYGEPTEDSDLDICIVTDDFTTDVNEFELFGLKTQKDIIDKINSILQNWLPF